MAKSTNKKTSVKKATAKKQTKKDQDQLKLTTKDVKKISAEKEPEKIETKKVEQISKAPDPEKIESKEALKLETKTTKTVKKAGAKGAEKETKTATKKKTTAKKSTAKKTVKKEDKEEKTVKEKAAKTTKKKKIEIYESLSLDEVLHRVQSMGVHHVYEDYAKFLLDEANVKQITENIIEGNHLKEQNFTFDKDGFDTDLIPVLLQKVADTMDIKATDFKDIKKDIAECMKTSISDDAEANAVEYLKEFKVCEKILMIGQRKNITEASVVSELIDADVDGFVSHFFTLAYEILPTWQYDDVKFYEDFAYAVLSQYCDLYEKYQLNILLDVADLYIKHGDFQHGDECYGYILRDNQIKDYIYYRFAAVYEDIDLNKAKALANESLQFVDERFTYYSNIMTILNK